MWRAGNVARWEPIAGDSLPMTLPAAFLALALSAVPATAQIVLGQSASGPASQALSEIDRKEKDLVAAWEKSPLVIRKAVFVTEKAPLYGAYSPRPSNVFKKGEPVLAYLEPVGYGWKPEGDAFILGITLDVVLKSKDGKILGGQEKFLNSQQTSRHKLRELMLNVTLSLGSTPGDYVVEFVAKDLGGKSGSVSMPFTIAE